MTTTDPRPPLLADACFTEHDEDSARYLHRVWLLSSDDKRAEAWRAERAEYAVAAQVAERDARAVVVVVIVVPMRPIERAAADRDIARRAARTDTATLAHVRTGAGAAEGGRLLRSMDDRADVRRAAVYARREASQASDAGWPA